MTTMVRQIVLAARPKGKPLLTDFRLGYYRYNIITHKSDQTAEFANTLGIPGLNSGDYYTGGSPTFNIAKLPGGSGTPVDGNNYNYGDGEVGGGAPRRGGEVAERGHRHST